CARWQSIFDYW
nr:immunoglobulin heavy chain junction region [Macaca mulatta]MOY25337.1 immunoglobulin heavy chain junction region [Macaca mulatta]MOY25372.1 immunoglobulin heavy chain junction region [Macaca mulatta]MOY25916.1 immunoglobulin heavy chain junction region [Macaca mulatta]MOY27741.1 immunoglobulin heavy chain junction region [Macaca mulatta]